MSVQYNINPKSTDVLPRLDSFLASLPIRDEWSIQFNFFSTIASAIMLVVNKTVDTYKMDTPTTVINIFSSQYLLPRQPWLLQVTEFIKDNILNARISPEGGGIVVSCAFCKPKGDSSRNSTNSWKLSLSYWPFLIITELSVLTSQLPTCC